MFWQDTEVVAIEYIGLDGESHCDKEYVTDGMTVQDILDGYTAIGCEIIRWYRW